MSLESFITILGICAAIITLIQFFIGIPNINSPSANNQTNTVMGRVIEHILKQLWNTFWTLFILIAAYYIYSQYFVKKYHQDSLSVKASEHKTAQKIHAK